MTNKQHALELLERLEPDQLAAIVHLLETFLDENGIPTEEEDSASLSDAELKAIAEADEWLKHNQPIPHEEVLGELGLTMTDWEKMGQKR
jgi:hypothetical protein